MTKKKYIRLIKNTYLSLIHKCGEGFRGCSTSGNEVDPPIVSGSWKKVKLIFHFGG